MLRPEPARFLGWKVLDRNEYRDAANLASVFVGLLVGYSATPTQYRGSFERQRLLSLLAGHIYGGEATVSRPQVKVESDLGTLRLVHVENTILTRRLSVLDELRRNGLLNSRWRKIAIDIDRRLSLGCVSTKLVIDNETWSVSPVENAPGQLEIVVPGHAAVSRQLDEARFLKVTATLVLPEQLEKELREKFPDNG